jgi:uroporphyrinogen-III synthase
LLARAGADVVHVPLIGIEVADDAGRALAGALARLDAFEWLIVTSHHGAERVAAAAAAHPSVRLAAVGTRTAAVLAELAGRPVDVVPVRQTAADLVSALTGRGGRALVAQADRAATALTDGLTDVGFVVEAVVAYRTISRTPTERERIALLGSDAVGFASGSAVEAWVGTIGHEAPGVVAAIGPTTAAVADRCGLKVTHVAADHSIDGLVDVITMALTTSS